MALEQSPMRLAGGWPNWVTEAPYVASAHPQAADLPPICEGANCQRYAYGILSLFGLQVSPHRSSELWSDVSLEHMQVADAHDLDLVLFNETDHAWGAHVAVVLGSRLLHLCAEEGVPAAWTWDAFASRERYARVVGVLRVGVSE